MTAEAVENIKGLIALSRTAGFCEYAAGQILTISGVKWSETYFWMIVAKLKRHASYHEVLQVLADWRGERHEKYASISKFIPGEHYHVLDAKFSTLAKARAHAIREGYLPGPLIEKRVYLEGD